MTFHIPCFRPLADITTNHHYHYQSGRSPRTNSLCLLPACLPPGSPETGVGALDSDGCRCRRLPYTALAAEEHEAFVHPVPGGEKLIQPGDTLLLQPRWRSHALERANAATTAAFAAPTAAAASVEICG